MPWSPPPAEGSPIQTAQRCISASVPRILSFRNSSPGAIPPRSVEQGRVARSLLRETLFQHRPAPLRALEEAGRIGGKGIAAFFPPEQIKPLSGDDPETRIAGIGHTASEIGRIIAAELRTVDFRMGDKGGAVALIAEAPDRAGLRGLELGHTLDRGGIGEIGDGVEAL